MQMSLSVFLIITRTNSLISDNLVNMNMNMNMNIEDRLSHLISLFWVELSPNNMYLVCMYHLIWFKWMRFILIWLLDWMMQGLNDAGSNVEGFRRQYSLSHFRPFKHLDKKVFYSVNFFFLRLQYLAWSCCD